MKTQTLLKTGPLQNRFRSSLLLKKENRLSIKRCSPLAATLPSQHIHPGKHDLLRNTENADNRVRCRRRFGCIRWRRDLTTGADNDHEELRMILPPRIQMSNISTMLLVHHVLTYILAIHRTPALSNTTRNIRRPTNRFQRTPPHHRLEVYVLEDPSGVFLLERTEKTNS